MRQSSTSPRSKLLGFGYCVGPVQLRPGGLFVPGGAPGFASKTLLPATRASSSRAKHFALRNSRFSPTMVNQVTGGYNRIFNYITLRGPQLHSQQLGIPGANINCDSGKSVRGQQLRPGLDFSQRRFWVLVTAALRPSRVAPTCYPSLTP